MEAISEVITLMFSKQGGLILLEKLPIFIVGIFIGIFLQKVKEVLQRD